MSLGITVSIASATIADSASSVFFALAFASASAVLISAFTALTVPATNSLLNPVTGRLRSSSFIFPVSMPFKFAFTALYKLLFSGATGCILRLSIFAPSSLGVRVEASIPVISV